MDIFRKVDTMSRPMADTPKRRPRRRFDDDFKAQAVRLVLDEGKSVGSVARDLDLTETALREWVHRARADRTTILCRCMRHAQWVLRVGTTRVVGTGATRPCPSGPSTNGPTITMAARGMERAQLGPQHTDESARHPARDVCA